MLRDDLTRLRHMLDAASLAVSFASGRQRRDLNVDLMAVLAMVKAVEIVGEAASRLDPAFRLKHPQVPWSQVISMRNRLVHAYFDLDVDILWETVTRDLPPLVHQFEQILEQETQA